ncbi:anthranilate synthase component I family protein [Desulfofundulus thermosubterraneus]|uniref:Anthranilate synthase component 1 n=1 Tax=Desulfofundulus thermosubterraneus DSM 16057 TaxID=1121432 RepID=A0A1M6HGA7_9FIRM|nr:chorismate-binding protein [Desulfofundulus thermosubterraneus]SHJ21221.1 anthranilate synthase component 1 [Desulfofundulus thermosubterraneus DSM 16057]
MIFPSEEEYLQLASHYRLVPVSAEWEADMETPISLFSRLATRGPSFLLESVEGGEKLARYSFIGLEPLALYHQKDGLGQIILGAGNSSGLIDAIKSVRRECMIAYRRGLLSNGTDGVTSGGSGCRYYMEGNPFVIVEQLMNYLRGPHLPALPRFYGGAVGYFGYDLVRWLERLPFSATDDLGLPDMILIFTGTVLILDHVRHTLRAVVNTIPGGEPSGAYRQAVGTIEKIYRLINGSSAHREAISGLKPCRKLDMHGFQQQALKKCSSTNKSAGSSISTNLTQGEFISLVQKAKEYIRQGEILQVVLSQRLQVPFNGDPFQVYRRLRRINPSPYLYYLNLGPVVMAGSSPEMLVRVEGDTVETRPIAGTRPRGATVSEDEALAAELLADPKERAEHVMLVDLGRNDLGRVCTPGSVTVPQFMSVEKYSHVMHLVSSVQGVLAPNASAFDAFKACFPAGTVSGAPKVRAMEIIEELEPLRRGPYAGAVGYLGYNGNLDTAITIRTVTFYKGFAYVQAGAGIVADSVPEREYQETLNKARALLQTLDLENEG